MSNCSRALAVACRRSADETDKRVWRLSQDAGTENEHEPAAARVLPANAAHARDSCFERTSDDVELHPVADVDAETLVDALLD